jgi:D-3-phosphoglycerate dehydrogenase / 2-oxoglutarate reductase
LFMVNDAYMNAFRKDIYIINTARGQILKTGDLIKNLKSGKVKGACLDVLEFESLSFETISKGNNPTLDFLIESRNVILSPHIAGSSNESIQKIAAVLGDKILMGFNPEIA